MAAFQQSLSLNSEGAWSLALKGEAWINGCTVRFVITNSSPIWRALMKGNHVRLCAYRNAIKAPNKRR